MRMPRNGSLPKFRTSAGSDDRPCTARSLLESIPLLATHPLCPAVPPNRHLALDAGRTSIASAAPHLRTEVCRPNPNPCCKLSARPILEGKAAQELFQHKPPTRAAQPAIAETTPAAFLTDAAGLLAFPVTGP